MEDMLRQLSSMQLSIVLAIATVILLVAFVVLLSRNMWIFTSLRINTYQFVESGDGNLWRALSNVPDTYIDPKTYNVYITRDKDGKPVSEIPQRSALFLFFYYFFGVGFFLWFMHSFLGAWLIGIPGIHSVHTFNISKAHLVDGPSEVTRKNKKSGETTILDRVSQDATLHPVRELRAFIQRPLPFMRVATKDNFRPNVLIHVMLRVRNPRTVVFEINPEHFFSILYSAVSGATTNYLRTQTHQDFLNGDLSSDSPLARAILALNKPQDLPTSSVTDEAASGSTDRVKSLGIQKALGVEIIQVWIEQIDEDPRATEAQQNLSIATVKAKQTEVEADAEKYKLKAEAEGKTEEARLLVAAFGGKGKGEELARDVQEARLLASGNITTLVQDRGGRRKNGATGTSMMLPTNNPKPTPPTTPKKSSSSEDSPDTDSDSSEPASPPSSE